MKLEKICCAEFLVNLLKNPTKELTCTIVHKKMNGCLDDYSKDWDLDSIIGRIDDKENNNIPLFWKNHKYCHYCGKKINLRVTFKED